MTRNPCLLIVTGHPAAGKTTLARFLSGQLALPLLSKDYVKETLHDQLGATGYQDSTRLGRAAFEVIFALAESWLSAGISVILESPIRADMEDSRIARLESGCPCKATQIVLTGDASVLLDRYRQRSLDPARHPSHFDKERNSEIAAMLAEPFKPLAVSGGTITVDTSDWNDVDYDSILNWVLQSTDLKDRGQSVSSANREKSAP